MSVKQIPQHSTLQAATSAAFAYGFGQSDNGGGYPLEAGLMAQVGERVYRSVGTGTDVASSWLDTSTWDNLSGVVSGFKAQLQSTVTGGAYTNVDDTAYGIEVSFDANALLQEAAANTAGQIRDARLRLNYKGKIKGFFGGANLPVEDGLRFITSEEITIPKTLITIEAGARYSFDNDGNLTNVMYNPGSQPPYVTLHDFSQGLPVPGSVVLAAALTDGFSGEVEVNIWTPDGADPDNQYYLLRTNNGALIEWRSVTGGGYTDPFFVDMTTHGNMQTRSYALIDNNVSSQDIVIEKDVVVTINNGRYEADEDGTIQGDMVTVAGGDNDIDELFLYQILAENKPPYGNAGQTVWAPATTGLSSALVVFMQALLDLGQADVINNMSTLIDIGAENLRSATDIDTMIDDKVNPVIASVAALVSYGPTKAVELLTVLDSFGVDNLLDAGDVNTLIDARVDMRRPLAVIDYPASKGSSDPAHPSAFGIPFEASYENTFVISKPPGYVGAMLAFTTGTGPATVIHPIVGA